MKLGPNAQREAERLVRDDSVEPDVVLVIYTKNISKTEGLTGLGIAAVFDIQPDQVRKVLTWALQSLNDGN